MKKFEISTTGTAMRSGSVAPIGSVLTGDVCPQPVRRRLGGVTDAGNATPGLPPSAPPIT